MIAVFGSLALAASSAGAQNLLEYSSQAAHSAAISGTTAAASRAVFEKTAEAADVQKLPALSEPRQPTTLPVKKIMMADLSPSPKQPAVFILADGERLESRSYLLTTKSVRLQQGPQERIIPIDQVNIGATLVANHERCIDLKFPKESSKVMIGF